MGIECKTDVPGGTNRESGSDPNTDFMQSQYPSKTVKPIVSRPSLSGSISPIDTCSATSVCTNITVVENLKDLRSMCARNQTNIQRVTSSREEPLQPDVAYSDVQLTPRNADFDDENSARTGAKEIIQRITVATNCSEGLTPAPTPTSAAVSTVENEEGDVQVKCAPRI